MLYSSPLLVTSNVILTANAFETNFDNSVAASALFTVQPLVLTPMGFNPTNGFRLEFSGLTGSNYVLRGNDQLH